MLDVGYYGNFVVFNILILLKYHYYENDAAMKDLLEESITLVIYLMLIILAIKFLYESIPWSWLKKKLIDGEDNDEVSG